MLSKIYDNLTATMWLVILSYFWLILCSAFFAWFFNHEDFLRTLVLRFDDWQTFSAAMVALLAANITLQAANLREENKRKANFHAAKAFLPEAFEEWNKIAGKNIIYIRKTGQATIGESIEGFDRPDTHIPESTRAVIRDCLRYSDSKTAIFLNYLLMLHNSCIHNTSYAEEQYQANYSDVSISNNADEPCEINALGWCFLYSILLLSQNRFQNKFEPPICPNKEMILQTYLNFDWEINDINFISYDLMCQNYKELFF